MKNLRPGFSMITVILLILLMSMVSVGVLEMTGKTVGTAKLSFKREQSILLAKSYTEMAVMAASSRNCLNEIHATDNGYTINVKITYVGNDINSVCPSQNSVGGQVKYAPSRGVVVIVATEVIYSDPHLAGQSIRYYRRTVQKL